MDAKESAAGRVNLLHGPDLARGGKLPTAGLAPNHQ